MTVTVTVLATYHKGKAFLLAEDVAEGSLCVWNVVCVWKVDADGGAPV